MDEMKSPQPQQRGFALIVVVLLVGLMSLSVAAMLDLVGVDQLLSRRQAQSQQALAAAETGLYETISSRAFDTSKPTSFDNPVQSYAFAGEANSLLADSVVEEALDARYDTEVVLIGLGQVSNCNLQRCARLTYDVTTAAQTGGGLGRSNVRVRLDQLVTLAPGRIPTPVYER